MEYMEEIKLPKFKTKEELEQFAMGLMTENESLKKVLTLKCESIKVLNGQLDSFFAIRTENQIKGEKIRALESDIASLKEKERKLLQEPPQKCKVDYKGMYESEVERARLRDNIGDALYKSMSWLYSRAPFWTKDKFRVYFQELLESNDYLRDASEKAMDFLFYRRNG